MVPVSTDQISVAVLLGPDGILYYHRLSHCM